MVPLNPCHYFLFIPYILDSQERGVQDVVQSGPKKLDHFWKFMYGDTKNYSIYVKMFSYLSRTFFTFKYFCTISEKPNYTEGTS